MKLGQKGFTLLEIILVLVIMSSILLLITNYGTQRMDQFRRDKTALQMQQILNAGLNYYVTNGRWPTQLSDMQPNFLPDPINSPYGGTYTTSNSASAPVFTVSVSVPSLANAQVLAGELPLAGAPTGPDGSGNYTVTAQVQIPGQNLNNARSVNYAGLYHHGECVPVPNCPPGMEAQIVVVPSGVSGVNDAPTKSDGTPCSTSTTYAADGSTTFTGNCTSISFYPISSFSASTTSIGTPDAVPTCDGTNSPAPCYKDVSGATWTQLASSDSPTGYFWRVCLQVYTEAKGSLVTIPNAGIGSANNQNMFWTQTLGQVFAVTRCTPSGGEPAGSTLNVWGQ